MVQGIRYHPCIGAWNETQVFISDSDIIHLDLAGTSIVVLDTAEAAMELLEKRSSIYSGR